MSTVNAELGKYNTLKIIAINDNGAYLDAGDLGEILLPNRYLPSHGKIGENIEVFI